MPDTRAAYEAWHERYEVDREADAPWHRLVKRYLAPARDLASRRVLEIACGRGGFAAWLGMHPSAPARLVAADFARAAVVKAQQHARRSGLHRAWFGVADIENLPYAPGAFDTVVCCETIEHVPRPRRALAELARVLAPRGRLFLTTPNYLGPLGLYRVYRWLVGRRFTEEGQPINHPLLLPRTLTWVRAAGLSIVAVDGGGHYLPVPGRPPVEVAFLERLRPLAKWIGVHSLIVAER